MTADLTSMKSAATIALQARRRQVLDLAAAIYEHPELSHEEHQASSRCRDILAGSGFTIKEVPGLPTGFVAEHVSDPAGPTIAMLAEYDALPAIGHGCGHHLIAGSAVGAGLALADLGTFPGRIKVIGCPAEEVGTGKQHLLDAGVFQSVDVGLTFHAYHSTSIMTSCTGVRQWELTFHGMASHAATDPWAGANALDGVMLTYQNLNSLRQFIRDGVRIHGIVTHGGDAFNVIPERASARIAVRANELDELHRVARRTLEQAEAAALASGTRLEAVEGARMEPVLHNAPLAQATAQNLRTLGQDVVDWPALASTDFGNVSRAIPALLFSVATWPASVAFHTREATKRGMSDQARQAMLTGAEAMAFTAIDIALRPELLAAIRENYDARATPGTVDQT